MEKKLENSLIRMYKKIRESPNMKGAEIAGLFVNFYYSESGSHSGLFTNDFTIIKDPSLDIMVMHMNDHGWKSPIYTQLLADFKEVKLSDFYSLWLRSTWEDPKEESYGDPIVRQVSKDYNGLRTSNVSREAEEYKGW